MTMPIEFGGYADLSPLINAEKKRLREKGWSSSEMKLGWIARRNVMRRRN